MILELKDGTTLEVQDGSYGGSIVCSITGLSQIAEIASKLTEDNLSKFSLGGVEYTDYLCDSGSWSTGVAMFSLRAKSEIEIAKDLIDVDSIPDDKADALPSLFDKWDVGVSYTVGKRVVYDGLVYRCVQAHTSQADWTPTAAPSLWSRSANPTEEFPAWVQPTGGHDAYQQGDKVSHKGKHWVSTANGNVWEPGVYGWDVISGDVTGA